MAPFRPTNINKRAYPGNASIIGPTCTATLGFSTTTCCSSTNVCGTCTGPINILGCRCTICRCPCCDVCCSCPCTVCGRTVPSGMWKSSEQYEASTRNAWGDDTGSSGAATCLCCTNVGFACTGNITDCGGFFFWCQGSAKYFVAPWCTQCTYLQETWKTTNGFSATWCAVSCANSLIGSCNWFVGTSTELQCAYDRRTYWDVVPNQFEFPLDIYWTRDEIDATTATYLPWQSGVHTQPRTKTTNWYTRAFRCTAS